MWWPWTRAVGCKQHAPNPRSSRPRSGTRDWQPTQRNNRRHRAAGSVRYHRTTSANPSRRHETRFWTHKLDWRPLEARLPVRPRAVSFGRRQQLHERPRLPVRPRAVALGRRQQRHERPRLPLRPRASALPCAAARQSSPHTHTAEWVVPAGGPQADHTGGVRCRCAWRYDGGPQRQ